MGNQFGPSRFRMGGGAFGPSRFQMGAGAFGSQSGVPVAPVISYSNGIYTSTQSGQWYRNGIAISGQTGLTYTYVPAADDNTVISQKPGALESNKLLRETDYLFVAEDFSGANGIDLHGYVSPHDGATWTEITSASTGRAKIYNNNLSQYLGANGRIFLRNGPPGGRGEVTLKGWHLVGNNDNTANTRYIYIRATDANNHVSLLLTNTGYSLGGKNAGAGVAGSGFVTRNFLATDDVTVVVDAAARAHVLVNGVEHSASAAVNGWDMSSVPAGTKVGLGITASQGTGTYGDAFQIASDFNVESIPATSIQIASVTTASPDIAANGHPYPTATITGTFNTGSTQLKVCVIDASGNVLQDFSAAQNVSGSAYNFTIPLSDPRTEGMGRRFVVADANDHTIAASILKDVGYFQTVPALMAVNTPDLRAGYTATNAFNMFGLLTSPGTLGLTDDGKPTIMPVGGIAWFADYAWPDDPTSEVYGTYDVSFPAGLTVTVTGANFVQSNVTATSCKITVSPGVVSPQIIWNGTLPADPNDLFFTMKKSGLSPSDAARFYRPAVRSYLAPFGGYRFLFTMRGWPSGTRPIITAVQDDTSLSWRVPNKAAPSPQVVADLGDTGKPLVLNFGHNWTPPAIRQFITETIARCSSPLHVRQSNEDWNGAFDAYYVCARATPNFSAGRRALSEGEWVKGATSGYKMYVCKQLIKTGSVAGNDAAGYIVGLDVLSTSAPGFTVGETLQLCDSAGTVLDANIGTIAAASAQHIKYARRARYLFDLVLAIPGAAARCVFGLEWQDAVGGWQTVFAAMLDEENLWQIVRQFDTSPYGDAWLSSYTDVSLMTKAEKDSVATDAAAWKALVVSRMRSNIDVRAAAWRAKADWLAGYNVSKDLNPNDIAMGTYEVSPNGMYSWTWPSVQFNAGTGTTPGENWTFKGRTSNLLFRTGLNGAPAVTSGSFAGGDAVGYFKNISYPYNGAYNTVRYPVAGEIFDRVDNAGTVIASAVFQAADASNLCYLALSTYADVMKSAAYGSDDWAYYIGKLTNTGMHNLFIAGGPANGSDLTAAENGWGWWGIGNFDNPAHPYAEIVAAIS